MEPEETVCHLLQIADLEVGFFITPPSDAVLCEQLVRDQLAILARPYAMVGSDGILVGSRPHPRAYGAFPRFLRYRKQYGLLSLAALVNRMTKVPADRFRLYDRGRRHRTKPLTLSYSVKTSRTKPRTKNPNNRPKVWLYSWSTARL